MGFDNKLLKWASVFSSLVFGMGLVAILACPTCLAIVIVLLGSYILIASSFFVEQKLLFFIAGIVLLVIGFAMKKYLKKKGCKVKYQQLFPEDDVL